MFTICYQSIQKLGFIDLDIFKDEIALLQGVARGMLIGKLYNAIKKKAEGVELDMKHAVEVIHIIPLGF